jgi:hypothetical protein
MLSDVCKPIRDLATTKIASIVRSKLSYFTSCFTARQVLETTFDQQRKLLAAENVSAFQQSSQGEILVCEERGILEQALITIRQEDKTKVTAFIKAFLALADTSLLQDAADPFFVRFYAHMILTFARNINSNDKLKEDIVEFLDLQVKTNEQTTY